MCFFVILGNYDFVKFIKIVVGKFDFLNDEGCEVVIFSLDYKNCKVL